jgi:hypothetical protein
MIGFASHSGNKLNTATLTFHGWGVMIAPSTAHPPSPGVRYAIDNGAWTAFCKKQEFDDRAFIRLVERHGAGADFVIVPDIVAAGMRSLDFSLSWLPRLERFPRLLIAVQDGMNEQTIANVLSLRPGLGIFLGGSTEWKLKTMYDWGRVARSGKWYYHVGRVNTVRRIRLCEEAGADSFDGSGVTKYFEDKFDRLNAARQQRSLLRPETGMEISNA